MSLCLEYLKKPKKSLKSTSEYYEKIGSNFGLNDTQYVRAIDLWSKDIRNRDKICQNCKNIKDLFAHHIFHKSKYPKMSLNLNNGITLCRRCHNESHGKF